MAPRRPMGMLRGLQETQENLFAEPSLGGVQSTKSHESVEHVLAAAADKLNSSTGAEVPEVSTCGCFPWRKRKNYVKRSSGVTEIDDVSERSGGDTAPNSKDSSRQTRISLGIPEVAWSPISSVPTSPSKKWDGEGGVVPLGMLQRCRKLGEGGMAEVLSAHLASGQFSTEVVKRVVVKYPLPGVHHAVESLESELKVMKALADQACSIKFKASVQRLKRANTMSAKGLAQAGAGAREEKGNGEGFPEWGLVHPFIIHLVGYGTATRAEYAAAKAAGAAEKEGVDPAAAPAAADQGGEGEEGQVQVPFLVLERLAHTLDDRVLAMSKAQTEKQINSTQGMLQRVHLALFWGLQIADACHFLHDEALPKGRIIHRDLKPENIGFSLDDTVRLMDFGLAQIVDRQFRCKPTTLKGSGDEVGTKRYMAPEIGRGEEYHEKVDVYSFSMILWEVLTLHKPFFHRHATSFENYVWHNHERPHLDKRWPQGLHRLLSECWDPEMDARPSFREIVGSIEGLLMEL
eukprot:CAMPEP_0113936312 /NCGR_PEP_ID=MMETSP1339-20121228/3242_1 /TAXON_ID=94617 /ORGANISM="Fibrocapsa japonica" /LENGTH=517 /DNA_ID=CAMNT_0000938735 /DNA_START=77 /DNA_END=1630 /DNA_ORIENTATION=- /assembly_acc=CAM_ASM_000762